MLDGKRLLSEPERIKAKDLEEIDEKSEDILWISNL
jgi:hypothetical protein